MKEAQFEYKCRRCGEIDSSLCTAKDNAMEALVDTVVGVRHNFRKGINVKLMGVCNCKDRGMGVSDLIGFKIVEKDEKI